MVNDELRAYIEQQLAAGVTEEALRKSVFDAGWERQVIADTFDAVLPPPADTPTLERPSSPVAETAVPPVLPISTPVSTYEEPARRSRLLLVGGAIALLLLLGGAGYAYLTGMIPFGSAAQYAENVFLSELLTKSSSITTASYSVSAALAVNKRDSDATAFVPPAVDAELEAQYARDYKRASELSKIISGLKKKYGGKDVYDTSLRRYVTSAAKPLPAKLSVSEMTSLVYPRGVQPGDASYIKEFAYTATEGGKNFALTATFETDAAVNEARRSRAYSATTTPIVGKKVTFTKDSDYFYLPSKAKKPFLVELADMVRQIPPDVSGEVTVAATTDFSSALPDWRFNVTAQGAFGDLSYAVDVEALKKKASYYLRVNKVPAFLLGSFSNYKGQWIEITPAATSASKTDRGSASLVTDQISSYEESYQKNRAELAEVLRQIVRAAEKHTLMSYKSAPTRDTVAGRSLTRYELTLNKEAVIPFYKELLAEAQTYKKIEITQDQGLLDYLQSEDFDDVFTYMKQNTFITLWTDSTGYPARLTYRLRVVPPDTATQFKGKQVDVTITLTFSDINKGVNIDTPKGARTLQSVIDEVEANAKSQGSSGRVSLL